MLSSPLFAAPRQDCAGCHRDQALPQPDTSMGHALESVETSGILRANSKLTFRQGDYSYAITREGATSTYSVTDGHETFKVPVAWAFGLGSAGQTYLYQWNGNWYESRVSFYKQIRGLDLTLGARANMPQNIGEAGGHRMSVKDAVECFGCHATNAIHDGVVDTSRLTPGVQCERCHGATEKHVAGIKTGDLKAAAMNKLGKLTTEELSDFCGQCHRTWSQIAMTGPHDINNVRFQPYRLTNSKCYDVLDRRISCVACHDPHREVVSGAASYDAKCQACHASGKASAHASTLQRAKPCPTASKDCTTCHMPKYEIPGSYYQFSDHWIRVVKAGDPYPG